MARSVKTTNLVRIALAAVLFVIALVLAWRQISPARPAPVLTPTYYYDLGSESLMIDTSDKVAPFPAPSGGLAVAAHVYSCTACTDDAQFIAFLTMFDDATRDALTAMTLEQRTYGGTDVQMLMSQGQLIRTLENDQWVPFDSEAGMSILQSPPLRCGNPDVPVMVCEPPTVD